MRDAFAAYRGPDAIGVVGYVMGGLPETVQLGRALIDAGVCALEVGIPFSDPVADGPTIRGQAEAAFALGSSTGQCLHQAAELAAEADIPIVVMGYVNPILAMGPTVFADELRVGGIAGAIVADAPVDEHLGIRSALASAGRAYVPLATPTSTDERLALLAAAARDDAFVYCVARRGVTGVRDSAPADGRDSTVRLLERVRHAAPKAPRVVGFGITRPSHVSALVPHAEAVVVASGMFDVMATVPSEQRIDAAAAFISELVAAGQPAARR